MKELIELAKKFMDDNYDINEIELTNGFGDKVRLVRNSPSIWINSPPVHQYSYQYPYQY